MSYASNTEPKRSKPTESSKSTAQQIDEQTEPKPKSTIKEKATGSTEGEVATFGASVFATDLKAVLMVTLSLIISIESRVLRQRTVPSTSESTGTESKSRRNDSTALRRQAMLAEIAQRKNVPEVRRLTQEELLAEAKLTEEINRRSLARYQRMEIEKKKVHFQKSKSTVPMIRYHSFTVPLVEDQPHLYGVSVDPQSAVISLARLMCPPVLSIFCSSTVRAGPIITDPSARCSRNLITFADEQCLRASMPKTITPLPDPNNPAPVAPRPRRIMRICPITGLPARYLDPVTLTPYANLAAFRVLRRLYQLHLETNTPAIDLLREYRNS
ncbi:YL1 nuclear protein [Opisthorchis viverrini]|uniref:Vacuolar protein sorting-associated protein 72 homolog n=1 Tax=Opisthorchis viverrini TaxID=6198 RepID=A0A1S8XAQ6_OPIVI|nr:YL1 nuclear protein [Opisthorchis viverrini]